MRTSAVIIACIAAMLAAACASQPHERYRSVTVIELRSDTDEGRIIAGFVEALRARGYQVSPSKTGSWHATLLDDTWKAPKLAERSISVHFARDSDYTRVHVITKEAGWLPDVEFIDPSGKPVGAVVAGSGPDQKQLRVRLRPAIPGKQLEDDRRVVIDAIFASQSE